MEGNDGITSEKEEDSNEFAMTVIIYRTKGLGYTHKMKITVGNRHEIRCYQIRYHKMLSRLNLKRK